MRILMLLVILGLVSFIGWQYGVIERHYAYVEDKCMFMFEKMDSCNK